MVYTIGGASAGNYTAPDNDGPSANITAKKLTISGTTVENKIYDKTAAATVTPSTLGGIETDDTVTVASATGTFASVNAGNGIGVTVVYTTGGASAGNYAAPDNDGPSANITPKEATLNWTAPSDLVYSKSAKTTTVAVSNLESGDSCTVTAALTSGNDNVNVGSFTYTASSLSNDNYKLPSYAGSPTYTILPADVAVTIQDKSVAYSGKTASVDPAVVTLISTDVFTGTVTYTYYGDPGCSVVIPASMVKDAATYYVIATTPAFGNYKAGESNIATLVITKKALTSDMITVGGPYLYDGTEKTVTFSVNDNGILKASDWADAAGTQKTGTNVGKYTVKIRATVEGNYSGEASKDWYIGVQSLKEIEDGKLNIGLYFSEVIRDDTTVEVKRTSDVSSETKKLLEGKGDVKYSYDITLFADGKEFQPTKEVAVKMLIPDNVKGAQYDIYHVHDGVAEKLDNTIDGDYVTVGVDDFSEFVFVKTGSNGTSVWFCIVLAAIAVLAIGIVVVYKRH